MERRWSARKNLYLGIRLEIPSYKQQEVAATLVDIGLGGAFIETEVLLPPNATLSLMLNLPGKSVRNYFRLNAKMIRRTLRGAGLVFVDMPTGLSAALGEALFQYEQQLEPLAPDMLAGSAAGAA